MKKNFQLRKEIGFIKNDYVHKKSFREEGILCCKYSLNNFSNLFLVETIIKLSNFSSKHPELRHFLSTLISEKQEVKF